MTSEAERQCEVIAAEELRKFNYTHLYSGIIRGGMFRVIFQGGTSGLQKWQTFSDGLTADEFREELKEHLGTVRRSVKHEAILRGNAPVRRHEQTVR